MKKPEYNSFAKLSILCCHFTILCLVPQLSHFASSVFTTIPSSLGFLSLLPHLEQLIEKYPNIRSVLLNQMITISSSSLMPKSSDTLLFASFMSFMAS